MIPKTSAKQANFQKLVQIVIARRDCKNCKNYRALPALVNNETMEYLVEIEHLYLVKKKC